MASLLHKAGVVHRDLKPANVMLVAGDSPRTHSGKAPSSVKLLDFHLANLRRHGEEPAMSMASQTTELVTLSAHGTIIGHAALYSARAAGAGCRCAYRHLALGAILYEMALCLHGRRWRPRCPPASALNNS